MRLAFEVTENDFWAGQEHLMFKAPEMKRYFRCSLGVGGLVALIVMPLISFLTTPARFHTPAFFATTFGSMAVAILFSLLMVRLGIRLGRPLSRLFFRKAIDQAIGPHELEIVPKGLHIYTAHGEQIVYWDSIGNIATSPEHTFIYLTRMQSVIVPQKRIRSGNYPAFMQAFADVYANRRDAALPTPTLATSTLPVTQPVEHEVVQRIEQGPR